MHPTEGRNPFSTHLDTLSSAAIVRLMNAEDRTVADAVLAEADRIAAAIDLIAERIARGGRLFYVGAGTSGRLGVLDAAECPPTFGVDSRLVVGVIAGGDVALREAVEGAEDSADAAATDLDAHALSALDVVVGIAASGRTPYVVGAVQHARSRGAATIGVMCARGATLSEIVDVAIAPSTGPEVIAGSTRLKAGTATKLVLNMLSTGAMVRLGHTYGNLMVDVRATNAKLAARARSIVAEVAGLPETDAAAALERADGSIKAAIVSARLQLPVDDAKALIERVGGRLRDALERGRIASDNDHQLVLGVDGGATKTVAWLADTEGRVLGRGVSGAGNPRSIGFSEAERNVDTAVASAFADAGIARRSVLRAGLSLAGVGRPEERDEIREWAERAAIASTVVVTDDAESVLAAGAPEGWGVALVSGTGTLAIGRNVEGETTRAGGWGYLLADEGGAYAIAVAGLRAAVRAVDGLAPATTLTDAIFARLDVRSAPEIVARIYGPEMSRERIGMLASTVFEEAGRDAIAARIVDEAAVALATLVGTIVTRLRLVAGEYPLALAGSVIVNQEDFRAAILDELARRGQSPRVTRVVTDPVAGAVRLAMMVDD